MVVGERVIEAVVCPVLHEYVLPPEAVRVAVFPGQMVALPAVAVTLLDETIVTVPVLVQPLASVIVAV